MSEQLTLRAAFFVILLFGLSFAEAAATERRVALVVGNSRYEHVSPLENPAKDAALVAMTLKSLGFSIVGDTAQLDLDKNALDIAIQRFGTDVQGAEVAMFYYAGHGVQVGGSNYIVPVGANPTREADVDFQMTNLDLVLKQMQDAGTRLNLVVLDACRNNPFGGRALRSSEAGLAQIRAPEGTLISYATQPGNVASDGSDGHSPYTRALADTMRRPGLDIFQTFNQIGLLVKRSTAGAQQPWVSSSPIDGSFYFSGAPDNTVQAQAEATPSGSLEQQQKANTNHSTKTGPEGITDCDRFAANPVDANRVRGVPGVKQPQIDIVPALAACNAALQRYPDVNRFVYQSGRIAYAQKDYPRARQFFEKAAAANYPIAFNGVGVLYFNGLGVTKDYIAARQWFERGSAYNDANSMNATGYMYEQGFGVPKNGAIASQWYEKALVSGSFSANGNLGRLYYHGNGVPKDLVKAKTLAEKGAADGDPAAMSLLGLIYQTGAGIPADLTQARRWYERSVAGGDLAGMNNLGHLYMAGLGVDKDYVQARALFEKAAAGGRVTAMSALGNIYLNGLGISKDLSRARQWLEKASAGGDSWATKTLSEINSSKRIR